jgi:tetratricopeptide (TPR) repeat protein
VLTKAALDLDKVDAAPVPTLPDTLTCVQSNAAAAAAVRPEERYLYQYRKGYCELFAATINGSSDGFRAAVTDFNEAMAGWPIKKYFAGPPAGLRALVAIARLEQGRAADSYPDLARDLTSIASDTNCAVTPVMSQPFCASLVDTARAWLGWLAYRRSDFANAARQFQGLPASPWNAWIAGRIAQDQKRPAEAASLYQKAIDGWTAALKTASPDVPTLLGPKLDRAAVYYQLGLVDYSIQRYDGAIAHFDAALKEAPRNSYAIYLRARSKEALKLYGPALDDYALAVQTARATNDSSWAVGQAHFQRGLLLYRSKDFSRSEAEFGSAAGARITEVTGADITAWRAMAAVAGGGCTTADALEAAAKSSSDQFPKAEAEALAYNCRLKQAKDLDQYLALEKQYAGRLDPVRRRELRDRIAAMYADQGVAAEDRKDSYAAVAAYRHALEWNPTNAKARFNLGAIYIEDKRYNMAEAEYRALVDADASDYEAHYWLAQSILAQHPTQPRAAAACEYLRRSMAINDPEKKAEFGKAFANAKCAN